jgi:hypothetical protein
VILLTYVHCNQNLTTHQGYFVDVPLDPDKANANLANLLNNNWVDSQTRRLLVTLEAWNLQLDQITVMFWDTEFNPGGHMRNFFSASVVRVHYYDKPEDQSRLALEIICVIFWLYYLYSEWEQVYKAYKLVQLFLFCLLLALSIPLFVLVPISSKLLHIRNGFMAAYLKSGWNIADHLQILLLLVCIAMWIDVINSPPPLPDVQKKVAIVGFNDDTLTDTEVFQLSIVAQKFQTYLLVTSVHIFILIVKASTLSY